MHLRRRGATAPLLVASLFASAFAAPLRADTLCLKDGRVIDGPTMTRDQDAILVKFKNGDVRVPNALVEEALLAADAQDATKGSAMAKRIQDRRKYVDEIKKGSEWAHRHKESTKHFDFESTLVPTVFGTYRDLMEGYFAEFQKMWGVKAPKDRVPVCFYLDSDMFHQTSGADPYTLGYFKFPRPHMELDFYYDRLDPDATTEVMFHETNHYLQKLINLDFAMPHFPGESLAEYYGASSWDDKAKKLTVGLVLEGRLCEIQQDLDGDKMMSLEKMLSTDQMYEHYTWGWSLVHFLMSTDKYSKKFLHFVNTLALGKDVKRDTRNFGSDRLLCVEPAEVLRVFMKCLDLKDKTALTALESEWHAYVKDKLKLVTARGFEEAGAHCMRMGRTIKAKRLLQSAVDGGSKKAGTYDKLAELLVTGEKDPKEAKDPFENAIGLWKKAIELDPLTAEYYAHLGHAWYNRGNKDEGKKLMQLALELDPDDAWLEYNVKKLLGGS